MIKNCTALKGFISVCIFNLFLGNCLAQDSVSPNGKTEDSLYIQASEILASEDLEKNLNSLNKLKEMAETLANSNGRAEDDLRESLQKIDRELAGKFSGEILRHFQGLLGQLGVPTERPILLPIDKVPYWFELEGQTPLENFQSQQELPKKVDVLIIGAGLTGASSAYHLTREAQKLGRKISVAILESGDAGKEASGRNGGNFQLFPEFFYGGYEGVVQERLKKLQMINPELNKEELIELAKHQANSILKITSINRDTFLDIIEKEKIDANVVRNGWIRVAISHEEEEGLKKDIELAHSMGLESEYWTPEKIKDLANIDTPYGGRWTEDGYYQPFLYTVGVLKSAIDKYGAQLFSRTPVQKIESLGEGRHIVETPRGKIEAGHIIVATNAFTRVLFPELNLIQPHKSHIIATAHVPVQCVRERRKMPIGEDAAEVEAVVNMLVTTKKGDLYAHPVDEYTDLELSEKTQGAVKLRGVLVQGGGIDTPYDGHPSLYRYEPSVYHIQLDDRKVLIDGEINKIPPVKAWSGPMAFTPDSLMALGPYKPGIFVAAGFNGYGGSFTQAAGKAAALTYLNGEVPEWADQTIFSPKRLLKEEK